MKTKINLRTLLLDAPVGVVTSSERVNTWLWQRDRFLAQLNRLALLLDDFEILANADIYMDTYIVRTEDDGPVETLGEFHTKRAELVKTIWEMIR